jgi:predicted RNA binding protein YcfA (HicA-like mRNA interferase family)
MHRPRSGPRVLWTHTKVARVLSALKCDGWVETRRRGSHRVLLKHDRQRISAWHEGVDLGESAMARIAKDYGYLAELDSYRSINPRAEWPQE